MTARQRWIFGTAWGIAIVFAMLVDIPVANWAHESGLWKAVKFGHYAKFLKLPGTFYFVLPVAIVLGVFHAWKWRATVLVALSGAMSGLIYVIAKWMVGRTRPFKPEAHPVGAFAVSPFHGGFRGLFIAENQSFPSGHVCLAFAAAAALARLFPRYSVVFYPFAIIVALERVAENAHYPSDVVAAAALGIVCAGLTWKAFAFLIPRESMVRNSEDKPFAVDPAGASHE
jgi:membrane-associated phospholipid phosphatase